jgi:hypothetical protein
MKKPISNKIAGGGKSVASKLIRQIALRRHPMSKDMETGPRWA